MSIGIRFSLSHKSQSSTIRRVLLTLSLPSASPSSSPSSPLRPKLSTAQLTGTATSEAGASHGYANHEAAAHANHIAAASCWLECTRARAEVNNEHLRYQVSEDTLVGIQSSMWGMMGYYDGETKAYAQNSPRQGLLASFKTLGAKGVVRLKNGVAGLKDGLKDGVKDGATRAKKRVKRGGVGLGRGGRQDEEARRPLMEHQAEDGWEQGEDQDDDDDDTRLKKGYTDIAGGAVTPVLHGLGHGLHARRPGENPFNDRAGSDARGSHVEDEEDGMDIS